MKTGLKILIGSALCGTGGFLCGWGMKGMKDEKDNRELERTLHEALDKARELEEIANVLAGNVPEATAEGRPEPGDIQNEYLGQTATDEDPPMPEEKPVIGDEAVVEKSPAIEFITEQEYYENKGGYAQEEMIFYSLDEVVWNKDTQSRLNTEEINRCLGYGTLQIFDADPLNQGTPEAIFVKNHILQSMFRVDFMDAAWIDEHTTQGEEADDE